MKLSVIIPVFNRAEMIPDTIDSVRCSGVDDLEIIVVDDGSTDHTADVVQALGSPVRYLRQSNAGPASARNTGFAVSRGRYVAFLDSDDQWLPGSVAAMIDQLDEHEDIPFVFADALMGSPDKGFVSVLDTYGGDAFRNLLSREIEPGLRRLERDPVFRQLVRRNFVFLGSLVLRREVVEQVGCFDPVLFGSEDWEFCLRLALRFEFFFCEGISLAVYNQHSSASLTGNQDRMYGSYVKALERVLESPRLGADERVQVIRNLKPHSIRICLSCLRSGRLPRGTRTVF